MSRETILFADEPPTRDARDDAEAPRTTRPFHWSVRRELWENRSIWLAPLGVAALVVVATAIHLLDLAGRIAELEPAARHAAVVRPFTLAPAPIMLAAFLVGVFYALDALYAERRDRSILFWKSLPVSDRTTVLAKASIPIVVLPLIAFVLSILAFAALLIVGTMALAARGAGAAMVWTEVQWLQEPVVMLYGLVAHALWFAPIYAWLLLVSAWAKRTPLLWAVLPPLAIGLVERIFGGSAFARLLGDRVSGAMKAAFDLPPGGALDRIGQLDPAGFLAAPGLWLGLAFAAACLAAAIRVRRTAEPI